MSIKNPFAKSYNNTNTNNISNNNNIQNYSQKNQPANLPPKKSEIQNKNNTYNNIDNSLNSPNIPHFPQQNFVNTPQFQNNINQTPLNNYYDDSNDDEFNQLKNEYESKMKPLNASSEYISTTSSIFPSNEETLSKLSIPISVSLCPLKNTGIELPLINYGDKNIPRCPNSNCRAYLNPFVKWIEGGKNGFVISVDKLIILMIIIIVMWTKTEKDWMQDKRRNYAAGHMNLLQINHIGKKEKIQLKQCIFSFLRLL